jgi:hypothetical protein
VGWDAGGFNTISARCEVVLSEMHLGLDNGELIAEMAESVVLAAELLNFSSGIPIVEVGNGASEHVIGGGRTVEEGVEPCGDGFGNLLG